MDVYEAYYVAHVFAFTPDTITIPRGARVTFYVTSPDVVHGFSIPLTDVNVMRRPRLGQFGCPHVHGPGDVSDGLQRVLRFGAPVHGVEGRGDPVSTSTPAVDLTAPSMHATFWAENRVVARSHLYRHRCARGRGVVRTAPGVLARALAGHAAVAGLLPRADDPRRPHGDRVHVLLHHRLHAFRGLSDRAARPDALGRLDRLLDDADRDADGGVRDPRRKRNGALHVLRADEGAPGVLHRDDPDRRRDVDRRLRGHRERVLVEAPPSRPARCRSSCTVRPSPTSCGSSRRSASRSR